MEPVTVACAQLAPSVGDEPANRELARTAIRDAAAAGAQIIMLPELVTSGYVFESAEEAQALAQPVDGPAVQTWVEEAGRAGAVVVGGFAEMGGDGHVYNSAAIVDGTGVLAVHRKLHLWDAEQLVFTPGDRTAPVVDTAHGRLGLVVCYDMEFPELTRSVALRGADLICVPTCWPLEQEIDGRPMIVTIAAATARLSRVCVAVCDRCGTERGVEFEGGSAIADHRGHVVAGPVCDRGPETLVAELDFAAARQKQWSDRNDVFGDRRPDLYDLDPAGS